MMSLKDRQDEVVSQFAMFDDWLDKYEYLIDLGKNLPLFPESLKTEDRLVKGCQSKVWLEAKVNEGKMEFTADSDALITKGIIALLIYVYSGTKVEEIANDDFSFIDKLGLKENLSPTRSNGLVSMIEKIKYLAKNVSK